MKISTKGRYALRIMIDLAMNAGESPVRVKDIASRQNISEKYLEQIIALFNKAVMDFPGGCNIGDRSLDFHFEVFKKMGVQIFLSQDISMKCDKFNGCTISFVKKSVGATINTLILAGYCSKPVKIYRYSLEPEVIHTIEFLKKIGYRIHFMKDYLLVSYHRPYKKKYTYTIVEDRIEAISYALIGLSSKKLKLINVPHKELISFYECLDQMGANYKIVKNKLIIKKSNLKPVNVVASTYPAFPTDAQPLIAALLATVDGTSKVVDTIFKDRFNYANSLKAMGAKITTDNGIIITGTKLSGAVVKGFDLRGVFALIIAAISASGKTTILDGEIAKRGYEDLINKLIKIGVKIRYI